MKQLEKVNKGKAAHLSSKRENSTRLHAHVAEQIEEKEEEGKRKQKMHKRQINFRNTRNLP